MRVFVKRNNEFFLKHEDGKIYPLETAIRAGFIALGDVATIKEAIRNKTIIDINVEQFFKERRLQEQSSTFASLQRINVIQDNALPDLTALSPSQLLELVRDWNRTLMIVGDLISDVHRNFQKGGMNFGGTSSLERRINASLEDRQSEIKRQVEGLISAAVPSAATEDKKKLVECIKAIHKFIEEIFSYAEQFNPGNSELSKVHRPMFNRSLEKTKAACEEAVAQASQSAARDPVRIVAAFDPKEIAGPNPPRPRQQRGVGISSFAIQQMLKDLKGDDAKIRSEIARVSKECDSIRIDCDVQASLEQQALEKINAQKEKLQELKGKFEHAAKRTSKLLEDLLLKKDSRTVLEPLIKLYEEAQVKEVYAQSQYLAALQMDTNAATFRELMLYKGNRLDAERKLARMQTELEQLNNSLEKCIAEIVKYMGMLESANKAAEGPDSGDESDGPDASDTGGVMPSVNLNFMYVSHGSRSKKDDSSERDRKEREKKERERLIEEQLQRERAAFLARQEEEEYQRQEEERCRREQQQQRTVTVQHARFY